MVSYNGTTFTYDGSGRRISKGSTTYTYDSAGKLVSGSDGLEYLYDMSGLLAVKYNNATLLLQ